MTVLNPFAFRPLQVTFWAVVVYLATVIPVIHIHETVPSPPAESALTRGISIVEAWADLANLTQYMHPANSHANDDVRVFLLQRIYQILDRNGVSYKTQADRSDGTSSVLTTPRNAPESIADTAAVVFDDLLTNVSFTTRYSEGRRSGLYFEGTNIYVYIRGTRDEAGDWWRAPADSPQAKAMQKQIVLVNAHFDSVSSSFGATDDGVGVVSCLQVVRYFSTPGNQPERGVVVLLNNAEEEFLLGATAFANSPLVPFIGTFVNLEGAGAGGRAVLFRATDLEVVKAYREAPHPHGTVIASDGFKQNWIQSETDYRVWVNALGYRGLDMAFMKPRLRYHTQQDDRRHTSTASVWHMLSGALASTKTLTGSAGDAVEDGETDAVWFDLFGDSLILLALRSLFAWSLTILIVSPLLVALILFLLHKFDKDYLFRASVEQPESADADSKVDIGGWKGFFRFPAALAVAGSAVYGTALLVCKVQPFAIYSHLYAVVTLMVTVFVFVFWVVMRVADFVRPSAFHRTHALFWLFGIFWVLLVVAAVGEDRGHIASGYVIVYLATSVFASLLISLLELFALKTKSAYIEELDSRMSALANGNEGDALISPTPGEGVSNNESTIENEPNDAGEATSGGLDEVPTETSPLIGGNIRNNRPTTFATGYRRSLSALLDERRREEAAAEVPSSGLWAVQSQPFGVEQGWSKYMPTWTWFLQFLILGPFNIIVAAQLLLLLGSAVQQTGTDGSDVLMPYLLVGALSVLALLPLTPFVHRVSRHIPLFFAVAFIGTLIYSFAVFPFSATNPFKFTLRQDFSVDHGNSSVTLTGYEGYIHDIINNLPAAAGRRLACTATGGGKTGLLDCTFDGTGLEPRVDGDTTSPFSGSYEGLISVNVTRVPGKLAASFDITAVNTKVCGLRFDRPVKAVSVRGSSSALDTRFGFDKEPAPLDGNWEIGDFTLWRRDWKTPWTVDVEWAGDGNTDANTAGSLTGHVICRWVDANTPGTAPAADEAWKYAPTWSIMTIRQSPGLVQGSKAFAV
ncbi:peptidase family m28 family [Sporothrix brasiliensis 5110]|uniref:Peptide hydrolase n=1 Tax=Sporothrix brasiliensis 5110 TaxID=1398154 RepID=A0A0C2IGX6_9PEZI|nr:peptidase family m28 family [Sporothrix brasiliensis 5110]KIH88471.1 peptidase family m28 family [Sporothrix brasiliensis 5110]